MKKSSLKSQSGITMMSLIIYVASFLTVTVVIGFITTFFYNNVVTINDNLGSTSYYDAFNNCMLYEVYEHPELASAPTAKGGKYNGAGIKNEDAITFISFKYKKTVQTGVDGEGNPLTESRDAYDVFYYDKDLKTLYFNSSVVCKNVDEFSARSFKDASGKEVIETFIKINDVPFKTNYVLRNYE